MFAWLRNRLRKARDESRAEKEELDGYADRYIDILQAPYERVRADFYGLADITEGVTVERTPPDQPLDSRLPPSARDLFQEVRRIEFLETHIVVARDNVKEVPEWPGGFLLCYEDDGAPALLAWHRDGVYIVREDVGDDPFRDAPIFPSIYHWLMVHTLG